MLHRVRVAILGQPRSGPHDLHRHHEHEVHDGHRREEAQQRRPRASGASRRLPRPWAAPPTGRSAGCRRPAPRRRRWRSGRAPMSGSDGSRAASQSHASRMTAPTDGHDQVGDHGPEHRRRRVACLPHPDVEPRTLGRLRARVPAVRRRSSAARPGIIVAQERQHRAAGQRLRGVAREVADRRHEPVELRPRAATRRRPHAAARAARRRRAPRSSDARAPRQPRRPTSRRSGTRWWWPARVGGPSTSTPSTCRQRAAEPPGQPLGTLECPGQTDVHQQPADASGEAQEDAPG